MGIKSASELIDYNYRQVWANLSRLPRPCYMLPSHPAPVIPQSQYTAAVARWAPGTTQQYSATAAACPRVISSLFRILSKPPVAACPSYRRVVSIRDVTATP